MRTSALIVVIALSSTASVSAQVRPATSNSSGADRDNEQPAISQQQQTPLDTNQAGRTAISSVGQVGQRQTRDSEAAKIGVKPLARIASRINNRVQIRIRSRIDQYYDPEANATDPFVVAADQGRVRRRRR